jgi:DNA-binding transcriptional LysR family regulator
MPLIGMLLTPAISAFAIAHPKIELDIDFSDRLVDVIDEGFDVVLRTGVASDSQLVSRNLGTYSYTIVAAPDYFARAGTPVEPEDLLRHVCLHHRWPGTGKLENWRLMRDHTCLDLDLPVCALSSTIEPLIGMAERGVGIIAMPTFAVRRQLNEGALVPVLDQFLTDTGTLRMMWPKDRQLLPRLRIFIDFMRQHLLDAMAYR